LKLVFYYPCEFEHAYAMIHGPMGLTYIAAHLQKELGVEDVKIEVDIDRVLAHKPDLVGVSSYTQTYPQALAGAWRVKKELGVPVMLGGAHMNAIPEGLPLGGPFDVGAYGEGEHTSVELVRRFLANRWEPASFGDIPGVVFYDHQNRQIKTPRAETTDHLDSICSPRRELLEAWFPPQGSVGQWRQGLYTSRDCPFRCRFCIHSVIQGMPRYHSVERVISELEQIMRDYPEQKVVTIYDDIFVVSKKRLIEIVDAIRAAGIHKRLGFVAMIKPSTFNYEIALLLKEMNVQLIAFGFETGSAEVLKYLKGRGARLSQHQEALEICRSLNIRTTGYFIMGSPLETHQDLAKTYWFIRHNLNEMHTAGMFTLVPFPGTRFWDDYQQYTGKSPDHLGWEAFNTKFMDWEEDYPFFINQHYTPEFLKAAYREFADLRPRLASAPDLDREEDRVIGYKQALYAYITPIMGQTTRLLEVATYANSYYETTLFEERPVTLYALNQPEHSLPAEPFDSLYLNHCLEAQPDPVSFLKGILSQVTIEGPIYLSFYNGLFLPLIERLLSGQSLEVFEPAHLQNQHKIFSLPQMLKLLHQIGLEVSDVYRNPQKLDANSEFSQRVLPTIKTLADSDLAREFEVYSYFLVLKRAIFPA
jgi:anaerobic magnesium-protoporphyrin IX monomethyl ester cyclase